MKKLLSVLLLFTALSAGAQVLGFLNQNFVMIGGAIFNVMKTPVELVKAFQSINFKKKYKKFKQNKEEQGNLEALASLPENHCSVVCIESFDILAEAKEKMQPNTGEHLLDFLNEKVDFAGHH